MRVREIIRQVCAENGVDIINGVLSGDHVHMFVSIPPKLSVSDFMRKIKGRSSYLVQKEFPALKKRYWGKHFWGRGYFSTTNGAITDTPATKNKPGLVPGFVSWCVGAGPNRPAAAAHRGSASERSLISLAGAPYPSLSSGKALSSQLRASGSARAK